MRRDAVLLTRLGDIRLADRHYHKRGLFERLGDSKVELDIAEDCRRCAQSDIFDRFFVICGAEQFARGVEYGRRDPVIDLGILSDRGFERCRESSSSWKTPVPMPTM